MVIYVQVRRARAWFPCVDLPTGGCPFELAVTVAQEQLAVCSGQLVRQTHSAAAGTRTFHYRLPRAASPCQLAMAVGEPLLCCPTFWLRVYGITLPPNHGCRWTAVVQLKGLRHEPYSTCGAFSAGTRMRFPRGTARRLTTDDAPARSCPEPCDYKVISAGRRQALGLETNGRLLPCHVHALGLEADGMLYAGLTPTASSVQIVQTT